MCVCVCSSAHAHDSAHQNIVFDGVRVVEAANTAVASYHLCSGVAGGVARGDTRPVPPCFEDQTDTEA